MFWSLLKNCKTDYKGDHVKITNVFKLSISLALHATVDYKNKGTFNEHWKPYATELCTKATQTHAIGY